MIDTAMNPHTFHFLRVSSALALSVFIANPLNANGRPDAGSARSAGFAEAFVAVADDAGAIGANPAGLAQIRQSFLSTEFSSLLTGLGDGSTARSYRLAWVQKIGRDTTLAVSGRSRNAGDLVRERGASVAIARPAPFSLRGERWHFGATAAAVDRRFDPGVYGSAAVNNAGVVTDRSDPVFAGDRSARYLSAGAGVLMTAGMDARWRLGLSFSNLNRPNAALSGTDRLAVVSRIGAARQFENGLLSVELRRAKSLQDRVDHDLAVGGERSWDAGDAGRLAIRGGIEASDRDGRRVAAGVSIDHPGMRLDYGFSLALGGLGGLPSHRIGVAVPFGESYDARKPEPATTELTLEEGLSARTLAAVKRQMEAAPAIVAFWTRAAAARAHAEPRRRDEDKPVFVDLEGRDRGFAEAAFAYYLKGNDAEAAAYLALLSPAAARHADVSGLAMLVDAGRVETAVGQDQDLSAALPALTRLAGAMPMDPVVAKLTRAAQLKERTALVTGSPTLASRR